ncbi:hypothetical protein ECE50_002030 [Chitinophaga sp. Mgbs1]|uniref:Uncharacterized protein n=1 Tax=Chitinophaga solisilvae TaxID=1233460 RepID=A0A9Q5CWF4_9BACT|nr:hypothetical protein [Chitinophaga solisilvae]
MSRKRLLPWILIVALSGLVYLLTMLIPDTFLYYFFRDYSRLRLSFENKIPFHGEYFIYALPFLIMMANVYELCSRPDDVPLYRWARSWLTLGLSFVAAGLIYLCLGKPQIWNLFYSHRGIPAVAFSMLAAVLTFGWLLCVEGVRLVIAIARWVKARRQPK